ncbi:lipopolysaccharide biosynthesis regulator YciM [Litorivivens lipolytica]|uniref:Lipopolysaccharide assembly protein B n=1 Tax=Litorivivens lipolytica TaxID=1524264 RepID=A0A7W4W431_9GAMM|nr:lipopolysaccharide assembly protein LapB [Litorivivens lipolytica]MBB3046768.1 lipopolysaccharide biosynthesis regulator YciM [Litorivivens lipolytica]
MPEFGQVLLLVVAIAIGWFLGRRQRPKSPARDEDATSAAAAHYYQGLNFLLHEQPDVAIDSFVSSLEVNRDTLETHLAVGSLLRRKGEVDRAIRIHQNLLARPNLGGDQLHQVHMELAQDYIRAGLLDRAERMLKDLVQQSPAWRRSALRHLLAIYQDEREWDNAIDVAKELMPKKGWLRAGAPAEDDTHRCLAHFYCEKAELAYAAKDLHSARTDLKLAMHYDRQCVRASMLLGEIELDCGHPQAAIKALKRVFTQNRLYIGEVLELMHQAYRKRGEEAEFVDYLKACYEEYPSSAVLLKLVELLDTLQPGDQAELFLAQQLKRRPTLKGLLQVINYQAPKASDSNRENLTVLQRMLTELLQDKPSYQCDHCGFSGHQLHWHCPTCKHWGCIAPIRGAEGD